MSIYKLPRTAKNAVFAEIQRLELDPLDFEWSPFTKRDGTNDGERVVHRPTEAFFEMSHSHSEIWCSWSPALRDGQRFIHRKSDLSVVELLGHWLAVVRQEHEAPDLWQQLQTEAQFITAGGAAADEAHFSQADLRLIVERIDALEVRIGAVAGPSATPEQLAHVHEVLERVKAAAPRLSKNDWKMVLLGAVTNVLVALALEPQKAREILHYVAIYIGPILSRLQNLIS